MPPDLFFAVAERLAHAAFALFAQATVVAGLTLLALRTTARRNPAVRHAVALAAVICLITSPALASGLDAPANASGWQEQPAWLLAALLALSLWVIGCGWLLLRWIAGCVASLRLRDGGVPLDAKRHAEALTATREALGVQSLPLILLSNHAQEPLAFGPWRSAVLLPIRLPEQLSPDELRDVLVHECAHLRQRHHLSALAGAFAGMLFWPHPLVRGVCRELAVAREEVCDNFVLRGGNAPRYARTLLALAEARPIVEPRTTTAAAPLVRFAVDHPVSRRLRISGKRRPGTLRQRVEGLLDRGRPRDTRCGRRQVPLLAFTCGSLVVSMAGVGMAANQPTGSLDQRPARVAPVRRNEPTAERERARMLQRNGWSQPPAVRVGRGER